jgi:hypothetical protein
MDEPRSCLVCGAPLAANRRRSARYCPGDRCRKAAQRKGIARSRDVVQLRKVQPAHIPGRQRKPSLEDLTHLVCDTAAIEAAFRFAASKADYRFRPMCSRLADAIGHALDEEGLR